MAETDSATRRPPPSPPPPASWRRAWTKLGLDLPTVLTMAKGGLPPAIMLAMLQSTAVAKEYGTMGYVAAIICSLSLCIFPRAKLVQGTITNALAVCLAAATSLFGMWTANRARANAPSPGRYNPSAAAIAGLWLFLNIYAVNVLRARNPLLAFPVIFYTTFIGICYTYGGGFYAMPQFVILVKLLLKAFLTGFAMSLGVGLVIFPLTQRDTFTKIATGYLKASQKLLLEQKKYLQNHESVTADDDDQGAQGPTGPKTPLETIQKVHEDLFTKLSAELPMAKREVSLAYLSTKDLSEAYKLLRATVLPLQGMTVILDILKGIREVHADSNDEHAWNHKQEDVANVMCTLHEPYEKIVTATNQALEHVLLVMRFTKQAKKMQNDEEGASSQCEPGTTGFAARFEETIQEFYSTRTEGLQKYFEDNDNPPAAGTTTGDTSELEKILVDIEKHNIAETAIRERKRSQLYLVLFMEHLLYSAARSVQDLVVFVDKKNAEGVLARRRLVYPTMRRVREWVQSITIGSSGGDDTELAECSDIGATKGGCGSALVQKRDPEHLPASNVAQRIGGFLARVGGVLVSEESGFGLRVACATLAASLPAFFPTTYAFYLDKRLSWAMVIIAIGMSPTSGPSIIGFVMRIVGTVAAIVFALINWYIVDSKTAGVLVFFWIFMAGYFYFLIKYPAFIQSVIMAILTHTLVIGYELQVRKIGPVASAAIGQSVLSINLLGGYRILCILAALAIAFIFTIFPYPMSTRTLIRKEVSSSLYMLARYYVNAIRIVRLRTQISDGEHHSRDAGIKRAQKHADRMLAQSLTTYDGLRKNLVFTVWEPSLRGRFPCATYGEIINCANNITNYISIIRYASRAFALSANVTDPSKGSWIAGLSALLKTFDHRIHQTASLFVVLSNSLGNAQPLPPFIDVPDALMITRAFNEKDPSILGIDHLHEPGYVAFAVLQVAAAAMSKDMKRLSSKVKCLVGQVDFNPPRSRGLESSATTIVNESTTNVILVDETESEKGKETKQA